MQAFPGLYEPVSSLSHLFGAVAFVGMGAVLLFRARRHPRQRHLAVYALTCVLQLIVSGVYHSLAPGPLRDVFLRLDLSAIFLLIAGTFTAIHGLLLCSKRHRGPLNFVWAIAIIGVVLSLACYDMMPTGCWLLMYLLQGWSGVASSYLIWRNHGPSYIVLPFLGGIVFTVGGFIEANEQLVFVPRLVGAHEAFHLAVLLGMSIFWIYILDAVDVEKRARLAVQREAREPNLPVVTARRALAEEQNI